MRNLNIICVGEEVVTWSVPNETTNISESRENQSNVIPDQMMMDTSNHKFGQWVNAPVLTEQVVVNVVNRHSCSLTTHDLKFQCSKRNYCQNIIYNSNSDPTLKRYQKEYFLN